MPVLHPYKDATLLMLFSKDSGYAFQLLFERYRNRIYKVAMLYVKTPEPAGDRFLRIMDLYPDPNNFLPMQADSMSGRYHTGSTGIFRGEKFFTYEDGREPFTAYWKNHTLTDATLTEPISCLALLPTLAEWTHARLPAGRELDGEFIAGCLTQKDYHKPHRLIYYVHTVPEVVKAGEWKYRKATANGQTTIELFDISCDPGERMNLAGRHPDTPARMIRLFNQYPDKSGKPMP